MKCQHAKATRWQTIRSLFNVWTRSAIAQNTIRFDCAAHILAFNNRAWIAAISTGRLSLSPDFRYRRCGRLLAGYRQFQKANRKMILRHGRMGLASKRTSDHDFAMRARWHGHTNHRFRKLRSRITLQCPRPLFELQARRQPKNNRSKLRTANG